MTQNDESQSLYDYKDISEGKMLILIVELALPLLLKKYFGVYVAD